MLCTVWKKASSTTWESLTVVVTRTIGCIDVGGVIAVCIWIAYVCNTWRNKPWSTTCAQKLSSPGRQHTTTCLNARKRIKRRRARLNKCVQNMGGRRPHPSCAECYRHLFFSPSQLKPKWTRLSISPPMSESTTKETTTCESDGRCMLLIKMTARIEERPSTL